MQATDVRLTAAQMAAFDEIPDDQKTGIKPKFEKLTTDRYTNVETFERERQAVFLNRPIPIAASAQLGKPNSFIRQDIVGRPILLTRDGEGQVRAFINVCRHRGVILCPNHEQQNGRLIVCPFHAWSFSLDGRLMGVPQQEIFDGLQKSDYRLTELACREAGGVIWVGLDPERHYDFTIETGQLARELEGIHLDQARLFTSRKFIVKSNWKLMMDTTLDSYHVTRLHRDTVASMFDDSPVIVERVGMHLRNASARGNFSRAALSDKVSELRKVAVITYQLFPSAVMILSPHYTSFEMFRPISPTETEVEFVMLTQHPEGNPDTEAKLQKSFEFMCGVFGEDFWAAEIGQQGIASGDIKELTLGGMECQMSTFHNMVDEQIAAYYST